MPASPSRPRLCACCLLARQQTPATERVAIKPGEYQSGADAQEAWLCAECAAQHTEPERCACGAPVVPGFASCEPCYQAKVQAALDRGWRGIR